MIFMIGSREIDELFLEHVSHEIDVARRKWPTNVDKFAALTEEVGELAQAMLKNKHEHGATEDVWREAVQVAAMAMRVATEGSAEMPYNPHEIFLKFIGTAPSKGD